MKKLLLFASLTFAVAGFSQSEITHFMGNTQITGGDDGFSARGYYRGTFESAPDESATGPNATWDFSGVVFEQMESYSNALPTDAEIANYPECNFVSTGYDMETSAEVGKLYAKFFNVGEFVILGNTLDVLSLTFSGDGASVGQFPMSYESTSSDVVSGTFVYSGPQGDFNGDFTGTMTSTYDAYGTIDYVLENTETSASVNRLSVVLNLTFGTADFPSAGTLMQTSNYYYDGNGFWPSIRSVKSHFMVPLLSIDQTTTYLEKSTDALLSTPETVANALSVYPNPVKDILRISGISGNIQASIFDVNGRLMLNQQINSNGIDLSSLQNGIYLVKVSDDTGTTTQKVVKQ
ncbi:T9SS type A sorting domain-containing protein [Flavobacterium silvaticum]|uniref:T9SS type A sorting domain-containing protein n=1 Tax=Flavobacterium silvaticum TaxID=1852020 RepID=A0A972FKR8_9FLAO|nr:T9SS type A sorting domain-containing protein [Flavobacterium silvaticum]NMH27482.1 T9SS type A sorting domain-containing protein [Flavobacterium silvaticum]